tara:strand:- start:2159 stop:2569 length:411 start_codon:yes stop_codon:yes gene_type:complete
MSDKSYIVFPLKRIAATIYDLFLLLGVWFAVGSFAVWFNGGIIETKWVGPVIVFLSSWLFYGYFWKNGGKTLGMAVWKFEIYSLKNKPLTFSQISIRFLLNVITFFMLGVPLIYIYFSKNNLSISDIFSGTSYKRI